MNPLDPAPSDRPWPDYRAVWRWHFYAGLFCIPFVIVLSISGSIYLFKPQIESWIDRPYDALPVSGPTASAAEQIRAALAAVPASSLNSYEVPVHTNDAARVVVSGASGNTRVYVHPVSLEILHTVPESQRFMRVLFRLHGELLMGNRGSAIVELAASWAIVMIVTGLHLWWPRKAKGLAGILYPRLVGTRRMFWRDLHGVTGFWISGLALVLLLTGLPWAKFWGDYFRNVRKLTGTAVARQDWTNGAESTPRVSSGQSGEHRGHGGVSGWRRGKRATPSDLAAVDRIVATVRPLGLDPPVVLEPPSSGSDDWSVKSMTQNRPRRVDLVVAGKTGDVLERKNFRDRHIIDRVVGTGIAAHEGQLFGWPNQLLGLLTAIGLVLLSFSSIVMWWRRREPGMLGAPTAAAEPRWSWGLAITVLLLAVYLPLFGCSLLVVLTFDLLLRRIPRACAWLGLGSAERSPEAFPTGA